MNRKYHLLACITLIFVFAILPDKLFAFEVVEITDSHVKGTTILSSQGKDYEIVLTLQSPENEHTVLSAIWYIPKDAVSVKYPIYSDFVLPEDEIKEIVRIYDNTYDCTLETLSNLITTLQGNLGVKSSGSVCYSQTIKNVFVRENVLFCYHSTVENIVYSLDQISYYTIMSYRILPFLGVDMSKLTIYVPYGCKENYSKLAWYRKTKAIIECDPEEKWQEILNEN